MADVLICPVGSPDVGEILTLQRAAYVTEAKIYNDISLPALTQTYDELAAELQSSIALKALMGYRIIGAGRAHVKARSCTSGG